MIGLSSQLSPPVVLVVDDSPVGLRVLAEILKDSCRVITAASGLECLEAALTHRPDLILLDVMMPDMDGYETCSRLKADPATKDIPVIFVTASANEDDEVWGLEIGAVDYIIKPYKVAVVRARVKNHIQLKRYREHLEEVCTQDGLTGIANYRKFDEYLGQEWKRALRYNRPLGVIVASLDSFRAFNDAYGHLHGDDTLRTVALTLQAATRRSADLVARLEGTTFGAILPETAPEGVSAVANTLRESVLALAIPHHTAENHSTLTLSAGCAAMVPDKDASPYQLLEKARDALKQAKASGRNCAVCLCDQG